jgi:ATP-binding cassette subfamily B protein
MMYCTALPGSHSFPFRHDDAHYDLHRNLGYVGKAILGGYLAVRGSISVGDIQAFIQYVRSFTQPLVQVAQIANVMQSTAASAERVFEFLAEEEQVPDSTTPVTPARVEGNVEFKDVKFRLQPGQTDHQKLFSRRKAGQKVAIVGPTGAGKTTMVKSC